MLLKSGLKIILKFIKEDTTIKYYYTDKRYKELLSNMVILHDSREQTSGHILEYFDKINIKHEKRALKTGDYSFKIKACSELGFPIDTYFTDDLVIERKNGVKELAGNFANNQKDDRFMRELNRTINIDNVYIIVENDRLDDIMNHKYDTDYNELSFLRTLLTWQKRSNFYLNFVNKENMGKFIYEICKNCLDNYILK
jgi:ERCC4-type nuclease